MSRVVLLGLLLVVALFFVADARYMDIPMKGKRRMVIRFPFVKNPDSEHLSRILHRVNERAFAEQKQKKLSEAFDEVL